MPKQNDWHKNHNKTKQFRNNRILQPEGDYCTHVAFPLPMVGCKRAGGGKWLVESPESFLQYRAFCVQCVFTWWFFVRTRYPFCRRPGCLPPPLECHHQVHRILFPSVFAPFGLSYMRTMKWLANIQLLFALVGLFSFSVCPNAPHNCCRCFVHQTMGKHRATRATIATFVVSYLFGCMAKLPKHCC